MKNSKQFTWNGKQCIVIVTYEINSLCNYVGSDSKFSVPNKEIFEPGEKFIIYTIK